MSFLDNIVNTVAKSTTGSSGFDLGALAQLATNTGANQSTMTSALSVVGNYLAKSLKAKKAEGENPEELMKQYSGNQPNPQAVDSIFSAGQKKELGEKLESQGVLSSNVSQVLAALVPIGLQFLQSMNKEGSGNTMLKSFLDSDGDGDLDLADAMNIAGKFMRS